ncbi:MAG: hypothetical protein RI885_1632 [Actinomycetota bacterium]
MDLRLAIPAASAWIAIAITIGVPSALPILAVAGWIVAAVTIGIAVRSRAFRAAVVIAVIASAIALVATSAAMQGPARHSDLIDAAAESGRRVDVLATTTESVHASTTSFAARMVRATVSGTTATLDVPIRVFSREGADQVPLGSTLRTTGTVVATDSGDTTAYLVFADDPIEVVAPPPWILQTGDALREGLRTLSAELPGDGAALLPGLAVGDTSAVGDVLDQAMKASSLSHLTAVSGANCAVVVGLVMLIGGLIGLGRGWRVLLSIVTLIGFVILVTPEPSVLRAAVMAAIVLLGIAAGRQSAGLPVLAVAVIALLTIDPWLARDYGFVLSVLATAGLLLLAGPLSTAIGRVLPAPLAVLVAIPLAAQFACQPVLVLLAPTLPTYGVVANILAGPAAPVATVLGLLACVVAPAAPWLAGLLVHLAWLPASWIAGVAAFFAAAPGSRLPWFGDAGGVTVTALVTIAIVVLLLAPSGLPRPLWMIAAVTVSVIVAGYAGIAVGGAVRTAITRPSDWVYGACDIGQGDASLVRSDDRIAVIDVGPEPERMTACLDALGIARVDLLVLTHFDLDHVGGAQALVGRVDTVLTGPVDRPEAQRVVDLLSAGGARIENVSRGHTGSLGRFRWTVLWPTDPLRGVEPGNDASVTMYFDAAADCTACPSGLFLGDLGESAQARMIAPTSLGRVDVVKVAHHGSADQSAALYERVRASVALIGVGADNDYGHPTDRLLDILTSTGTEVTRTDLDGLVLLAPAPDGGLKIWRERGG